MAFLVDMFYYDLEHFFLQEQNYSHENSGIWKTQKAIFQFVQVLFPGIKSVVELLPLLFSKCPMCAVTDNYFSLGLADFAVDHFSSYSWKRCFYLLVI